jgi:hypothetical protein
MVRWIAFDDETAEAVVSRFKRGAAEIHDGEEPVNAALRAPNPSILILPSPNPGRVVVAMFHPHSSAQAQRESASERPIQVKHKPIRSEDATQAWWKESA